MSRVLLLGRGGQLGFELEKLLPDVGELIALDRNSLDISHLQSVKHKIEELRPDIIVNAAAYTAVDKAEDDEIACYAANASAVATIAREAKKIGALFVHYSTDY
ncbi:MAG TPA: sugar nucleotide-binding protein, partial [Campylobacterales bacterium]|nr:sugar nucleotide-binding protein [Campylobacterales bacterium]